MAGNLSSRDCGALRKGLTRGKVLRLPGEDVSATESETEEAIFDRLLGQFIVTEVDNCEEVLGSSRIKLQKTVCDI